MTPVIWSLVDQASFSGGNFFLNILLARWLSPAEYGSFVVVFTVYLLITTIHTGLLTEPMLVFGSTEYHHNLDTYLKAVITLHWYLCAALTAFIAISILVTMLLKYDFNFLNIITAVAVLPLLLFLNLARRFSYLLHAQKQAALLGLVYAITTIALIGLIISWHQVTASDALLIMGTSSLVCACSLIQVLKRISGLNKIKLSIRTVLQKHFDYGKWALPGNLLSWAPWNLPLLILPFFSSITEAGRLRTLINLVQPALVVISAANTLILPWLSQRRRNISFKKNTVKIAALTASFSLLYGLFIWLFGSAIYRVVYASDARISSNIFLILAFLPVLEATAVVFNCGLRAIEKIQFVFASYLAGAISIFLIFTITSPNISAKSSLLSIAFSLFTIIVASAFLFFAPLRQSVNRYT